MLKKSSTACIGSLGALALALCQCTGTETDNPIVDYRAGECNSSVDSALSVANGVARTSSALSIDDNAYRGLYCYAWEAREDGSLAIDVINYLGGCGASYELADTRIEGNEISFGVQAAGCQLGSCDSTCVYDLAFELHGVDIGAPVELQLREIACGDWDDELEPRLTLPLDTEPSGIICRTMVYSAGAPQCDRAHAPPCGGDYFGTCEDGCGDGLICLPGDGPARDMCFTACEQDDDCPIAIESCQDGACRLRETF